MRTRVKWITGLMGMSAFGLLFWMGYQYGLPVLANGSTVGYDMPGQYTLMALIALGTLVSEDLACISAGFLSSTGRLDFINATAAAFFGILMGDLLIFWMGMHFGRPFLRHRWARWFISERALTHSQHLFQRHGAWIILLTRFIPGTRTATYFSAGAVHAPFLRFAGVFFLAAILWTPLLVGVSHLVGSQLLEIYHLYEALALPALILAGLLLYIVLHYALPMLTWKGRRQLRGKWIRAVRWEYWPVWQVYAPVLAYVLYLGIFRYRCATLFTAVNPCMPHGGFLGESKADILRGLDAVGDDLPGWGPIEAGTVDERMEAVRDLMSTRGLAYPVVLKPDEGQRGAGVGIIRNGVEARDWLEGNPEPAILQDFVGGEEFGVFYARKPSESQGRIISVTIKEQLEVVGNGSDTLETLIHRHPRAIVLLSTFLDRLAEDLEWVPREGEHVPLGQLGTHALGALFLDGCHLVTPELTRRLDRIAGACQGFYFGRFDIKAQSADAFQCGRGLKILELNGVTSECTHIYDPRHGLLYGWKTLMAQWRLAFEIAEENRQLGTPPSPAWDFLRDLVVSWKRQRHLSRN